MRRTNRGFTLVEILIVVIILGILAAIVIPQFTNASGDARNSSLRSQLKTLRGQISLYKVQHSDNPPAVTSMWTHMLFPSNTTGTTNATANATFPFGPYMQQTPTNPLNGRTGVSTTATDTNAGWFYTVNGTQFTLQARDLNGNAITTY